MVSSETFLEGLCFLSNGYDAKNNISTFIMNKEIITVTSPLLPDLNEFNELLKQIWDNKWITNNGSFHKQLEAALAEYLKVPYVSLFTNGT